MRVQHVIHRSTGLRHLPFDDIREAIVAIYPHPVVLSLGVISGIVGVGALRRWDRVLEYSSSA